jgi:hypothetical protein
MRIAIVFFKNTFFVLIFLLALALSINTLRYLNFNPEYGFLRLKQAAVETGWYLPFYYSHVLIGGVILLAGLFQLHPKSSQRFRKTHRFLGYVYVMGILFFAAPGGFVMSLFIGRGPWVLTSFVLQSILWFWFTATAFNRIRQGDVIAHQQWMWRSYALTFAAITLRVYIFFTSYKFNLNDAQAYAMLAWLSWVPNLAVAEVLIRSKLIRSMR